MRALWRTSRFLGRQFVNQCLKIAQLSLPSDLRKKKFVSFCRVNWSNPRHTLALVLRQVILNGTSDTKVPTCLFSKGKAFKLPKQLDRFVHYIFNEKCRSSLECMAKHSDWLNPVRERTLVRVLKRQGSSEPS